MAGAWVKRHSNYYWMK